MFRNGTMAVVERLFFPLILSILIVLRLKSLEKVNLVFRRGEELAEYANNVIVYSDLQRLITLSAGLFFVVISIIRIMKLQNKALSSVELLLWLGVVLLSAIVG